MKKGLETLIIALIFLFCYDNISAETNKKIKIGVTSSLSGVAATYGQDLKDMVMFASNKFGLDRYELILEDDFCSGQGGVTVAHKFTSVDKVQAVIGAACSSAALAAAPVYERTKTPFMVVGASSMNIAHAGDYVFRTVPSDKLAASVLYNHMKQKHKSFAVFSEQTQYCKDFKTAIFDANGLDDIKIFSEDVISNSIDYRASLLKLMKTGAEALVINTQDEQGYIVTLKNLKQIGWKVPLYGIYFPSSASLLKAAKKDLEGIEFVDLPDLNVLQTEEGRSLFKEYVQKHGEPRSIPYEFVLAIDGFIALDEAFRSGQDVKEYLYKGHFRGIGGDFSFDRDGEIIGGAGHVIKKVIDGRIVALAHLD